MPPRNCISWAHTYSLVLRSSAWKRGKPEGGMSIFFFFNECLFRERDHTCQQVEGQRGGGRKRIPSSRRADGTEPDTRLNHMNCEIVT